MGPRPFGKAGDHHSEPYAARLHGDGLPFEEAADEPHMGHAPFGIHVEERLTYLIGALHLVNGAALRAPGGVAVVGGDVGAEEAVEQALAVRRLSFELGPVCGSRIIAFSRPTLLFIEMLIALLYELLRNGVTRGAVKVFPRLNAAFFPVNGEHRSLRYALALGVRERIDYEIMCFLQCKVSFILSKSRLHSADSSSFISARHAARSVHEAANSSAESSPSTYFRVL